VSKPLGRNEPCHCGSGRKYKHCCLEKDEQAEREARAKAEAEAPLPAPDAEARPERTPKPATQQPWKRGSLNTHAFQKIRPPRKVGG
jgi:hypothetical protein